MSGLLTSFVNQWDFPCHPTDLVYFRKRIGFNGVQKILEVSANIHGDKCREETVVIDTTVQEKNITFPTDTKLYYRVIQHLWRIGADAGIEFSHSYKRTVPKLRNILKTRSNRLTKNRKKARRKLKTLAGRLFRELCRKLSKEWLEVLEDELDVFEQILNQKKTDKNKIYSVHEPDVYCIGKGKAHKKWEFGSKVGIAVTANTGVIAGIMSFEENLYDGDTLEDMLYQIKRITGQEPKTALVDQGFKGRSKVYGTKIDVCTSGPLPKDPKARKKERIKRGRRAAIEPVIGHTKWDHRMIRNFLKGLLGDDINAMMAGAGFNFKKWMNSAYLFYVCLVSRLRKLWLAPNFITA